MVGVAEHRKCQEEDCGLWPAVPMFLGGHTLSLHQTGTLAAPSPAIRRWSPLPKSPGKPQCLLSNFTGPQLCLASI